jgi:hypothetical protein
MKQQLRRHPADPDTRQRAAVLASHTSLLLYALSELGMMPQAVLVQSTWRLSRGLLQEMAPADVAMLAVACGRFGAVPNQWWRNALLRVTAASAAAATAAAAAEDGASQQGSPQAEPSAAAVPLNPADISSLLTAAPSMNLQPPGWWVDAMLGAAVAQLRQFSLYQATVLLLSLGRLKAPPQLSWLLEITQHVLRLTGVDTDRLGGSSSSLLEEDSSSSGGVVGRGYSHVGSSSSSVAAPVLQHQQYRPPGQQLALLQPPAPAARLRQALLQQQQRQVLQHQQQQVAQQQLQQQPGPQQQQRVRYVHRSDPARLCLYLLALSRAVAQLPKGQQRQDALQQLQPLVAATAKQAATAFDRLAPLDLVQLLLGLQGLNCRPGPGFMSAFAACCEAQQNGFSPSLYGQLRVAYVGLGLAPPRSLLALMVAALSDNDSV